MLMLTTCCNRVSQHERILSDIDSLTATDADSARKMLLNLSQEMEGADADTKAYYNLLRVKADERAKKEHTSDSLICAVAEYFEQYDPNGHLAEAYFYAGLVNSSLQNGEKALLCFQKALLCDEENASPYLKSHCYQQIGYIYQRNGLLEDALGMQQLAYFYYKEMGDTLGERHSSEDIQTIKEMQSDSSLAVQPQAGVMMRIQKLHAQAKNQVLNNKNVQLEAENSKERQFIWIVSISALVIVVVATLLVLHLRKRRAIRKEEAAEIFLSSRSKRQFYDKDINQVLTTHIYNNKVLKDADWKKIEEGLLNAFPSFKERLYALYPLSDTEYRICMLIKLEVSPTNIAKLMAIGNSAVSQNRLRMQQKVFDGEGTAKDWDKFVLSL
jgi:tetratricopeptide (TPR) repeat protein